VLGISPMQSTVAGRIGAPARVIAQFFTVPVHALGIG
jgi:hypothetical protein